MESSLPRERHGERKARGDPGEPRRQRPFITDSGRGGLSKIYGIHKHLLTHCYRGVFAIAWEWWDIGEILRGRMETLIEGKEPRPGGCPPPTPPHRGEPSLPSPEGRLWLAPSVPLHLLGGSCFHRHFEWMPGAGRSGSELLAATPRVILRLTCWKQTCEWSWGCRRFWGEQPM